MRRRKQAGPCVVRRLPVRGLPRSRRGGDISPHSQAPARLRSAACVFALGNTLSRLKRARNARVSVFNTSLRPPCLG